MKELPSQSLLHNLFNYDPVTGFFFYKHKPNFRFKVGAVAGTVKKSGSSKGYRFIKIEGSLYQASRLAWMYYYGQDPGALTVDHIDHNPDNNAINNLRLASLSEQSFNRRYKKRVLPRGVTYVKAKNKYLANLHFRKAGICTTKQFDTPEQASEYYEQMRKQYGKDFVTHDFI